jgi:hypothetical protein
MTAPALKTGWRYARNLVARVAEQEGRKAALAAGMRLAAAETGALLRWPWVALRSARRSPLPHPSMDSEEIQRALAALPVEIGECTIDIPAFRRHLDAGDYPLSYAGGPLDEGGMREQKVLEYFVSLELLDPGLGDVLIDIASEWSLFPEVAARSGARVFRQDIIYPAGVRSGRMGGSAAAMPVPDGFASQMTLHNAFEHFEGTADTGFIHEAWRVLRPGGRVCILPLFLSEQHSALTDPLVSRRSLRWDPGAQVIELPWWHNRFGRFYEADSLWQRVLAPAQALGFHAQLLHFSNTKDVHPRTYLHYCLMLNKPRRGD